jgi:RHS repeat-associated protein
LEMLVAGSTLARAQSKTNGGLPASPNLSTTAHPIPMAVPKAPTQVELPPPPPMRYVPGLAEPLVATGPTTQREDSDLDTAIAAYTTAPSQVALQADFADYTKPLVAYVSEHPGSPWNAALLTDLGIGYYYAGYFSRALTSWQQAWVLGRNAATPQARIMVDRAVGELARMHARLGHEKELGALFADIGQRPISGPATEMIQGAHEGLWHFQHDPSIAYLCGPKALENLLATLKVTPDQIKIADDARSGPHGFSLMQLAALADQTKFNYKLIHREAGQPVPVPSVVNWKAHHYAAITGKKQGRYQVLDPTFGGNGGALLTANAIDAESSGYFLVPASVLDATPNSGWRTVNADSDEARAVYGMGFTGSDLPGTVMTNDKHADCDGDAPQVAPAQSSCAPQMTIADTIMMPVSLNLTDTPVGYRPQKGPSALVTLFYNQREDQQPANFSFSNVGPKWTFSWLAYVQDAPNNPGASVSRYASGGGGIVYPAGSYNSGTGTFTAETYDNSQLMRIPPTGPATSYQRNLPDGSTEVYALSNGAQMFPRIMFLTAVIDPAGNITTLNYDSQFRLTSVTDAMGRSTTLTYGISISSKLITRITDAFGRYSQLTYDTSQRLASITDPIGITSSFTYSVTEPTFITKLTTPYGVSVFSDALPTGDPSVANTRALTLTDPLGYTEFLYFYELQGFIPPSDPSNTVPTGMNTQNQYLDGRNTYYYDKHAFNYPGAVTKNANGSIQTEYPYDSHITHWVHDQYSFPAQTGRAPESIKPPLENRIWYNYPNQPSPIQSGYLDRPTAAGRVLVNGSTQQVTYATYNGGSGSFGGKPTSITDALRRLTQFTYASNNIDLLTVQQNTSSGLATIASFSNYNSQHEPQTYIGADGQTWHYTYNAAGQLATITDPNSGVTTFNYDSTGRLSTVQNPNLQTVLTLTYDSADRVRTRTDSQGYTLTYTYDNLDRVTQITYPDGTSDVYDWTFQSGPLQGTPSLELRKHTDRLGRVTTYAYDADRRLISVTEPISTGVNRTTSYDYYENGVLKDITDANGNVTHWEIDLESRPVSKTYAYGTTRAETETLAYEQTTSRLKSLTDALSQMKSYSYGADDRLTGITYTNAANPTPNVTFGYDPYFPRLTSMTDGTGTTSYTYTPIGTNGALQLASENGPFNNDSISYTYDALGRMSARNIPGANEAFSYDAISRLHSHSSGLGSFSYYYLGQTNQVTLRNLISRPGIHVSTGWSYDTNNNDRRLIAITNSGVTRSYTLSYVIPGGGGANNPYDVMSITESPAPGHPFGGDTHTYTYDLSDRLLSATFAPPINNHAYGYDLVDNTTSVTIGANQTQATYNQLNEISTWGGNNYFYDANGNTLSGDGTRSYKWDAENRLVEIDYVGSNAKSQFSYDGLGRRIIDVETGASGGTNTFRYLWCHNGHLCQTRDGGDTVLRRHLAEGELDVPNGEPLIYMPDQLGSVRDVLEGATGVLLDAYDYAPYGSFDHSFGYTPTDYHFAGLLYHSASGLNLGTYRALDGVTGRFINRDPIGFMGGINFYEYTRSNPINGMDALGLCDDPKRKQPCIPPESLPWDIRAELAALSFSAQLFGGVKAFGLGAAGAFAPPSVAGGGGSVQGLWIADSQGNEGLYWSVTGGPTGGKAGFGWIVGLQFMTSTFKSGVTVQDVVNSSISIGGAYGEGLAAGGDVSPQTNVVTLTLGFGAGGWGGASGLNIASGFIPICKE